MTQTGVEVAPKRLELLHELVPSGARHGPARQPDQSRSCRDPIRGSAGGGPHLGLELHVLNASTERDFDAVFAKLIELRAGGLVIGSDALFI